MTLIQLLQANVPVPLLDKALAAENTTAQVLELYAEIIDAARRQGLPIDRVISEVLRDAK